MDGQVNYISGKKRIDGECSVCLIFEVGDDEEAPAINHTDSSGKENPTQLVWLNLASIG